MALKGLVSKRSTVRTSKGSPRAVKGEMDWGLLLSSARRSTPERAKESKISIDDHRTPFEKDYDRVVFSAPVRRLKDKTQVFPLDMHDSVRTRLTHSLEVANLARSMGVAVATKLAALRKEQDSVRNVPSLLAAVSLTHDLGNPPFGHQGEVAIRTWVEKNEDAIKNEAGKLFDRDYLRDFLLFEGNAQGFRILTRLQQVDHRFGLNLTAATLRSYMKYPWSSARVSKRAGIKKFGYFRSEEEVFQWASAEVGVQEGVRHPLSYLMEVCDDIAYSILDIEDGVKKGIVSAPELISYLGVAHDGKKDERVEQLIRQYKTDRVWLSSMGLGPNEIRDSQIEIFRSYAIGILVSDAIKFFCERVNAGSLLKLKKGIAEEFGSASLIASFKDFAFERIYKHDSVIRAELKGHKSIPAIMDVLWRAVLGVRKGTASKVDEYAYSLISKNYIRVHEKSTELPLWYRDIQLVCDQVCGMTDSFAIRMYQDLKELEAI